MKRHPLSAEENPDITLWKRGKAEFFYVQNKPEKWRLIRLSGLEERYAPTLPIELQPYPFPSAAYRPGMDLAFDIAHLARSHAKSQLRFVENHGLLFGGQAFGDWKQQQEQVVGTDQSLLGKGALKAKNAGGENNVSQSALQNDDSNGLVSSEDSEVSDEGTALVEEAALVEEKALVEDSETWQAAIEEVNRILALALAIRITGEDGDAFENLVQEYLLFQQFLALREGADSQSNDSTANLQDDQKKGTPEALLARASSSLTAHLYFRLKSKLLRLLPGTLVYELYPAIDERQSREARERAFSETKQGVPPMNPNGVFFWDVKADSLLDVALVQILDALRVGTLFDQCPECGKFFWLHHKQTIFCSTSCATRLRVRKMRQKRKISPADTSEAKQASAANNA